MLDRRGSSRIPCFPQIVRSKAWTTGNWCRLVRAKDRAPIVPESESMRILAIETSGREGSLALLEGESGGELAAAGLVREVGVAGPERTAQILAPRLDELLRGAGWMADSIQLVAVTVGPGSFTGLRIGVTTAKVFAYAVGAEVVGMNTLRVIAHQAPPGDSPLWAVMDAQRQELFAAQFDGQGGALVETQIVSQLEWGAMLQAGDRVTGPGLRRLHRALPTSVEMVEQSLWQPLASTAGQVGWHEFQGGRRDDLWKLLPQYYRPSAADEKRDKERGRLGDRVQE